MSVNGAERGSQNIPPALPHPRIEQGKKKERSDNASTTPASRLLLLFLSAQQSKQNKKRDATSGSEMCDRSCDMSPVTVKVAPRL
jgi:hypothetical protein